MKKVYACYFEKLKRVVKYVIMKEKEAINMELEEYIEYIEKKMYEKGINIETQDYIIKYIYMNQKLFGRTLNINKVVDRILNNLDYSIASIDPKSNPLQEMIRISTTRGIWSPYDNKIIINPINKLKSILFKREKQKNDSTIMHEIDHCATTKYIHISEQEKEQYIQSYLERNKIEYLKIENRIRNVVNKMYDGSNGNLAISGIYDFRQLMQNGINLKKLNEGITAYKQEMYDKFLGNEPHTSYKIEKDVAKFIGDVIGKEELISMHFNNDYEGIRTAFYSKTGKELNELVKKLSKKSKLKTMLFGKMYTRNFSKKMEKSIEEFSVKKEQKRNTDFVPKFNVDYTTVGKFMEESQFQQYTGNSAKER